METEEIVPTEYDTEEDANTEVDRKISQQLGLFCPLIEDNCREDCVGFIMPYVTRTMLKVGKEWLVGDGECEILNIEF